MRKANMPKAGAGKAPARWKDNVMNERFSVRRRRPWAARDGAVLILSLLILAMITVLGVYTATRTAMEQQIANNMENQVEAFFSAEAGISHGRQVLQNAFVKYNEELMKYTTKTPPPLPNWSFLLNGTYNGKVAGTYWCGGYPMWASPDCAGGASPINGPWTTHGVEVLNRTITVGSKSVQYSVMVWDNIDYMFSAVLEADESYQGSDSSIKVITGKTPCEQPQVQYNSSGTLAVDMSDVANCLQNYDPVVDRDGSVFVRSTGTVSVGGQVVATASHELTFQGLIAGKGQIIPGLAQEFANEGHSSSGMDLHDISAGNLGSGTTL